MPKVFKILIFTAAGLLFLSIGGIGGFLFSKNIVFKKKVVQAQSMAEDLRKEIARVKSEKDKLVKENEKLASDAVSYLSLNTKLKDTQEKLKRELNKARKESKSKDRKIRELKEKIEKLEEKVSQKEDSESAKQNELIKQNEELKKKVSFLKDTLQKERALYHYNLGVAYTKAKLYGEAIEEYEKSLSFDLENPEADYNLGLLYWNFKKNKAKAIFYFRKYLELKPYAEDKEDVESWIERLKEPN